MARAAEAASANESAFGIVALDWKKAYDGVALDILGDTLGRTGIPPWAPNPLMDMYTRHRRIRVGTLVGNEWQPTCGIMAGCAVAVFVLAVCTKPWSLQVNRIENLTGRLYVDDSTAWATGTPNQVEQALEKGIAQTRAYEKATSWNLHPVKSTVSTTVKRVTKKVVTSTGPTGDAKVKDLGIIHQIGRRRKHNLKRPKSYGTGSVDCPDPK